MIRLFSGAALAASLAVVFWVAFTHAASHPAVLPVLALILAALGAGVAELRRYGHHTQALRDALGTVYSAPPDDAAPWVAALPSELQPAVRARLQGERAALPGPALTPFLAGLLVLLGLLGTFIGMVAALGGTVSALGASTDLQAVRAALAAPVQGLGLAFGTSVAGVACSAALGLNSALARAQRAQASRELDAALSSVLKVHTEAHRRGLMLQVLQDMSLQLQALPAVAQRMDAAMQSLQVQQQAHAQVLQEAQVRAFTKLQEDAQALGQALQRGLKEAAVEGAVQSRALVEPLVQSGLDQLLSQLTQHQAAMRDQAERTQSLLDGAVQALQQQAAGHAEQTQRQLGEGVQQLQQSLRAVAEQTHQQLREQSRNSQEALASSSAQLQAQLLAMGQRSSEDLVRHTGEGLARFLAQFETHTAQWLAQAGQEQSALQAALAASAESTVQAWREQAAASLAREREQLAEREQLLGAVQALMTQLQHTATGQAQALDGLLASAADKLHRSAEHFDAQAAQVAGSLAQATEQAASSSQTLASVGGQFAQSLEGFARVNTDLGEQLARIEAALGQSLARSDEQLAYYVTQARELIELTLGAQQQLLQDLHRVSRAATGSAVATTA